MDEVFEVTGTNPKLDIAVELEKRALDDDYFTERKLYPNVDFYSGLIYEALNLPPDMFTVMFAIPRTSGWIAQWLEMVAGPGDEDRPAAPDLHGRARADYVPIEQREKQPRSRAAQTNLIDPAQALAQAAAARLDPEHGHEPLLVLGLDLRDDLHVLLDPGAAQLGGEQLVDLEQPGRVVHRDLDLAPPSPRRARS